MSDSITLTIQTCGFIVLPDVRRFELTAVVEKLSYDDDFLVAS